MVAMARKRKPPGAKSTGAQNPARTRYKIGAAIKSARQAKNLKQQDVADKLGISINTYQNWEQGRSRPNKFAIQQLEKILGRIQ